VAGLVAWLTLVADMPVWLYAVAVAWPGVALSLLRSFAEHRAPRVAGQGATAAVVQAPLMGLLFLNNNLHTAHHRRPALAWYRLPRAFREAPAQLGADAAASGAGLYRGYGAVARRFLVRPIDHPVHPADRRLTGDAAPLVRDGTGLPDRPLDPAAAEAPGRPTLPAR
jgi:fatty acid desaturase